MSGSYSTLLKLRAEHANFPAASDGNFRLVPTQQCATLLDRVGILWRAAGSNLMLIGPPAARAELLTGYCAGADFDFGVYAGDSNFSLYTALDAPASGACLYFHSARAQPEAAQQWRLHFAALADAAAWCRPIAPNKTAALAGRSFNPVKPAFFLALAPAAIAAALRSMADLAVAPTFLVRLGVRNSYWKYYFLNDLGVPHTSIVDLDGNLDFVARGLTPMPVNRSADFHQQPGDRHAPEPRAAPAMARTG